MGTWPFILEYQVTGIVRKKIFLELSKSILSYQKFQAIGWDRIIKALRVLMGTAVFKRSSLQIGRFLVWYLLYNLRFS